MNLTLQFLRRVILVLLILTILCPVLVLGQDPTGPAPEPTTREPPPEPTTREPPPDPTTREPPPDPTTREPPTTRDDPPTSTREPPTSTREPPTSTREPPTSTREPTTTDDPTTDPPTLTTDVSTTSTTDSTTDTTSTITTTFTTSVPTVTPTATATQPTTPGSDCPQNCLTEAAGTVGCTNYADRTCICPKLEAFLSAASSCMQTRSCDPNQSAMAISEQRSSCPDGSAPTSTSTSSDPGPSGPSGPSGPGPISTPTPRPSPPQPTVGTQGGSSVGGRLTTETTVATLTPGQVVTWGVSGTLLTTFTARSSLTTTRIATMLEQMGPGGSSGDGASGGGNGAVGLHASYGLTMAVGLVGMMVGATLVL